MPKLRSIAILLSTVLLAACATPDQFVPSTVDGREYFAGVPQIAVGTLEEIRITEKDGTVHSFAKGASSVAAEGGGSIPLISGLSGMSSTGAGFAAAGIGFVFNSVAKSSAPDIELMIRKEPEGNLIGFQVTEHGLRQTQDYHCVNLGDRVRAIWHEQTREYGIYNFVPKLVRVSDFQPSCRQLRAEAGLPNTPEEK
ncbi:hypothetical protein CCAE64S_02660 [Castellaniella caeni]